ncbi:MAG TPA: zinc ribbon domain-containing protein [Parafilimonas sp.]|nr:zinc ribbon domain-containing protein [Parafilimonas sp.]
MNTENICQSCSMPLTDESLLGTEKDGSKNHEYCKYCYQGGSFVNPGMTVDQMESFIKQKMEEMNIDAGVTDRAMNVLPYLKRWKQQAILSLNN